MRQVPAEAWYAERVVMVRPRDLNTFQSVFGGYVMQRVDALATELVEHVSGLQAVTAHLERMTFRAGIAAFQRMRLVARALRTFHTSAEVEVEVTGEDPSAGRRWQTSSARLTVVALDAGGRPAPLPVLVPSTPEEWAAYEAAGARRAGPRRDLPDPALALPAEVPTADAERLCLAHSTRVVTGEVVGERGRATAGWILAIADELAAVTASRHAALPAVTAAVDGVSFGRPVPVGDVVLLHSYLTAAFHTSMEVRVEVWHVGRYGRRAEPVAACTFAYVALGPEGRPAAVPPFTPVGPREEALHAAALARRQARQAAS